jgi:hypothetical protein
MAKIRLKKKKTKYATVSRELLTNPDISLKAKGLGAWLELHEDGFEVNFEFNLNNMKVGRDSVRKTFYELKDKEFLVTIQTKSTTGQFETTWVFDSEGEVKNELAPTTENQYTESQYTENHITEKPTQIRKHNNKSKKKTLSSKKKETFNAFRERIKNEYQGVQLVQGAPGFLEDTVISLSSTGYLHNEVAQKDLDGEDAKKVWTYLYSHPNKIIPIHKETNK